MIMEKTIGFYFFVFTIPSIHLYAQHQKVRFSERENHIKSRFNLIENKTGLSVAYDSQAIDSQKQSHPFPGEIPWITNDFTVG